MFHPTNESIPLHPYPAPDIVSFSPDGSLLALAFPSSHSSAAVPDVLLVRHGPNGPSLSPMHASARQLITALTWAHDSSAVFAVFGDGTFFCWSVHSQTASAPASAHSHADTLSGPCMLVAMDTLTSIAEFPRVHYASASRTSLLAVGTASSGIKLLSISPSPHPFQLLRADSVALTLPLSDPSLPPVPMHSNHPHVTAVAWVPAAPFPTLTAALADGRLAMWEIRFDDDSVSGSAFGKAHTAANPAPFSLANTFPNAATVPAAYQPYAQPKLTATLLHSLWPSSHTSPYPARCLAWSPSGTYLAWTGADGTVSVWTAHRAQTHSTASITWRAWWSAPGTDAAWVATGGGAADDILTVVHASTSTLTTVQFPRDVPSLFTPGDPPSSFSPSTPPPALPTTTTHLALPTAPTCLAAHPHTPTLAIPSAVVGGFGPHAGPAGLIVAYTAPDLARAANVDAVLAARMGGLGAAGGGEVQGPLKDPMAFGGTAWTGVYTGSGDGAVWGQKGTGVAGRWGDGGFAARGFSTATSFGVTSTAGHTSTAGLPGYGVWTETGPTAAVFAGWGARRLGLGGVGNKADDGVTGIVGALGGMRIG